MLFDLPAREMVAGDRQLASGSGPGVRWCFAAFLCLGGSQLVSCLFRAQAFVTKDLTVTNKKLGKQSGVRLHIWDTAGEEAYVRLLRHIRAFFRGRGRPHLSALS